MPQERTTSNSRSRQCVGRPRSSSSSCVSELSDRSSELEVDSLPSRPYSSIGMQRAWAPHPLEHVDTDFFEDVTRPNIHPGSRPLRLAEGNGDSLAFRGIGMAPGAAYLMAPQVPLDADESNAVDPVTCPLFSQQGGEPLSSLCTPFDAPIMLNNTADLRKGQNIAHCDVSSAYAPYTATIPLFTNAPLAPTHPVALFYHHVASRQQPTWNYCVTHPPPHPGFAAPGIASSPVHTLPNMNVHPISLAHLEPPAPCALSGTRAVKQPLTQQIFLDEILVDHRRADAMEQRSKVQELEEAEEREQKNLLKLFKETPLAERGHWSLEAIRGHVLEFALDQKGSFWLQGKLAREYDHQSAERPAFETTLRWIFDEFRGSMLKLSMSTFGNFIAQPFYLLCSNLQRKFVLAELQPSTVKLCKHRHGCRVIQVIFRNSESAARRTIADAIRSDIVDISNSEHGNHVVQLALDTLRGDLPAFSHDLVGHIRPILMGKFGCKVAMRAYHVLPEWARDKIVGAMLANPHSIVNDPHGNYVWQHIVSHGSAGHREQLIFCLQGSLVKLSSNPFASWCCQKALVYANTTQREALIDELLRGGSEVLGDLATHKIGTHVLMMAMGVLKDIPWSQDRILQVLCVLEQVKLKRNLLDDARKCLARATEDLAKALLYSIR